jgi:membrane-associated protease RseP (regulator of RpoE activity)
MLRKLSAFILLATAASYGVVAVSAQRTPESPKAPAAPRAQTMVFSEFFGAGGSYLGVQTEEVTRENFSKFGLREVRGVAVEKVIENSPAAQAGLQDGDVIVRFNGEEITSARKLTRLISEVAPDHQARVTVLRGGSEREFTVTIGKRPEFKFEPGAFEKFEKITPPTGQFRVPTPPMGELPRIQALPEGRIFTPGQEGNVYFFGNSRQIGASVSTLTKQLGDYFGVEEGKGLLINDVRADSPAAKSGLRAGDVIVEVEGKPVKSMGDLIRGINEKKEGDVTLTIIRDRSRQTVRITPEKGKESGFFFNFDDNDGIKTIAPLIESLKTRVTPGPVIAPAPLNKLIAPTVIL